MGRLGCVSECVCLCICASLLPDVFWTVTLNESKYSIILEGLRRERDDAVTHREEEREGEREWITHASPFALHCGPCRGKRRQTAA